MNEKSQVGNYTANRSLRHRTTGATHTWTNLQNVVNDFLSSDGLPFSTFQVNHYRQGFAGDNGIEDHVAASKIELVFGPRVSGEGVDSSKCVTIGVELFDNVQDHISRTRSGDTPQVWSLTQFYSVDFSKSRIDVKKVHFQQTHNQGVH